ncbi:Uncharacterised protein [Chlamydia trachomatis]|nr:Uncharacterised protein [Chlamydia trachomatis]
MLSMPWGHRPNAVEFDMPLRASQDLGNLGLLRVLAGTRRIEERGFRFPFQLRAQAICSVQRQFRRAEPVGCPQS